MVTVHSSRGCMLAFTAQPWGGGARVGPSLSSTLLGFLWAVDVKSPGVANVGSQRTDLRSHSLHLINVSNVTFRGLRAEHTCFSVTWNLTRLMYRWRAVKGLKCRDVWLSALSFLYLHILSCCLLRLIHQLFFFKGMLMMTPSAHPYLFTPSIKKKAAQCHCGNSLRSATQGIIKLPSAICLVQVKPQRPFKSGKNDKQPIMVQDTRLIFTKIQKITKNRH